MKILLANRKIKEIATAQIAHLVFADTLANLKNQKSYFFTNAQRLAVSLKI
jgi:hypothetical protein